jgi:flagellar biosynthesis GTPase FlhF
MRQLRYEGPTLEAVLERILREVGPSARIAKAERIRKGGIAGFFAREHFAITLAAPGDDSTGSDVGTTLASLLRTPSTKEPQEVMKTKGKGTSVSRRPAAARNALVPGTPSSPRAKPIERSPGAPRPAKKPEPGKQRVADNADDQGEKDNSDSGRNPVPAAQFPEPNGAMQSSEALGNAFSRMAEETTDLVEISEPSTFERDKVPALSDGAFGSLLNEMIQSLEAEENASDAASPEESNPLAEDIFLPTPLEELVIDSYGSDQLEQDSPINTDITKLEPNQDAAENQVAIEEKQHRQRRRLCALGLPSHLLPEEFQEETPALDLLKSLSCLPRPPKPPSSAGSILVVVGEEARVLKTARQIASEMGLDPDAIPVASPVRLHKRIASRYLLKNSEAVAERLPSWRRRSHPTVVAVTVGMTSPHHSWARHVIEAMDATAVWGIVEATSKPADVAAWGRKLGGLDGLLVEDTLHTTTPADVLDLDIPVVRIDGCHATPEQWTAILTARLEEVDAEEQSA